VPIASEVRCEPDPAHQKMSDAARLRHKVAYGIRSDCAIVAATDIAPLDF
jgi:hypothetical protein